MLNKLKIAIVVHGRYDAFDLTRELLKKGYDVILLTNYPKYIIKQYDVPLHCVKSFLFHGILIRILNKFSLVFNYAQYEPFIHSYFGQWAAKELLKEPYDIIYVFSGVAEEIFDQFAHQSVCKTLVRESSHIKTQYQILLEEEIRAGVTVDKPSNWKIAREEREYQKADAVITISSFAYQSFLDQGFTTNQVKLILSGNQTAKFRPDESIINQRIQRILTNQPLNILMVGSFSLRKGAIDLIKIAQLAGENFKFRFVGNITEDAKHLISENLPIEFIPRQPQFELPSYYAWGDIFIFPTLEDGYPAVLGQAYASGLPILATPNSSAPDIIVENETGWIVPIRDPQTFLDKLQWCHENREKLTEMVKKAYENYHPRDYEDMAKDFVKVHQELLSKNS